MSSASSEHFLLPVLAALLDAFSFDILGFHGDHGPEYVNALLEKLHAELTKPRSRRTDDNALAATNNGSVVCKRFGHSEIPGRFAWKRNDFA